MKIAIIGAGAFGTALGGILAEKGLDIDYYDPKFERENLAEVVDGAKYILLTAPSQAVPYILPHLPKEIPLIVATKGILSAMTFRDFKDIMVLSGPGFADDIKAKKSTVLTATDQRVLELFSTSYLTFDFTTDNNGVLMCGALKNIYAIEAGVRGLSRGIKAWEEFIKAVCVEMKAILEANGAKGETVDLVCGVGDLMLTCGYPSRNFEFGDKLRQNPDYQPEKTVEGLTAVKKIVRKEIEIPDGLSIMEGIIGRFK